VINAREFPIVVVSLSAAGTPASMWRSSNLTMKPALVSQS